MICFKRITICPKLLLQGLGSLDLLQKNYENGGRQYYWLKNVSPFFTQYKEDPQFIALMENMKTKIDKMRQNEETEL